MALDIDAVIIGAHYGKGSRGAGADGDLYSEFTMGLRVPGSANSPPRFISFCRSAPALGNTVLCKPVWLLCK